MSPNAQKKAKTATRASWNDAEVKAMLHELMEKKETHMMSGNGFKPQVWAPVVAKIRQAQPDAKKDKQKCMNKLTYLKEIFDRYVFVQKFSGSGWDPEEKHASNTEAYVTDFVKTYGNEYARCFNSPCPYWTELDALYSGLINKATGENVVHLGRQKKSRTTSSAQVPLKPISGSTSSDVEVPIEAAGRSVFDDELDVGPILHEAGNNRERVDDRSVNGNISKSALKRRHSEYGGVARRNAEAGMQISRALDHLSVVIAQPILTSEDLSHVNEVVAILKDASLLPDDPRGRLYRAVSAALSHDATLARVFILEQDRTRRIGILEGILEDAGLLV